jgi:hypothetical protein
MGSIPKGLIETGSSPHIQIRQASLDLYNLQMQEDESLSTYTTNFRRLLHSITSFGGDAPKEELLATMYLQGLNSNYETLQALSSIGLQPTTTLQAVITAASNWKERKPPTAIAALSSAPSSTSSGAPTKRRYRKPKFNNQPKASDQKADEPDTPKNSTIGWGAGATHKSKSDWNSLSGPEKEKIIQKNAAAKKAREPAIPAFLFTDETDDSDE